jgi:hypothetical protein
VGGSDSRLNQKEKEMTKVIPIEFISAACPELVKAECAALQDHLHDTGSDYKDVYSIQAVARSLFPYSAKPKQNVVQFDDRYYVRSVITVLQQADQLFSLFKNKTNNLAQIQLDIQCCINYLNEELGERDDRTN